MRFARFRFFVLVVLMVMVVSVISLMRWGGYLLVSSDALPAQADAALVLQGSVLAESARLGEAVRLLHKGVVPQILVSIPKESYWGQSLEPIARVYVAKTYGELSAEHTIFCDTGPEVDATGPEAAVLANCVKHRDLHSVIVITSDYHTRRAKIIWRRMLRTNSTSISDLTVFGVSDDEYRARGWWRKRLFAKTWIMECTKLFWTLTVG